MYIAFGHLSHSISSYDGHSKNYKWYIRDKIAMFHMHSVEKGEESLLFKKISPSFLFPFIVIILWMSQLLSRLLFGAKEIYLLYDSFWSAKIAFAPKRSAHFQLGNLCLNVIEKGTDCNKKKIGENTWKLVYETAVFSYILKRRCLMRCETE